MFFVFFLTSRAFVLSSVIRFTDFPSFFKFPCLGCCWCNFRGAGGDGGDGGLDHAGSDGDTTIKMLITIMNAVINPVAPQTRKKPRKKLLTFQNPVCFFFLTANFWRTLFCFFLTNFSENRFVFFEFFFGGPGTVY